MSETDRAEAALATALRALATLTELGVGRAALAAALLRGPSNQFTPIDDAAALERVARLEQIGRGREAIGIVARELAGAPKAQAAAARRLRRKRANKSGHGDVSVSKTDVG